MRIETLTSFIVLYFVGKVSTEYKGKSFDGFIQKPLAKTKDVLNS